MKSLRNKLLGTTAELDSRTIETLVVILLVHVGLVKMTLAGDAALRKSSPTLWPAIWEEIVAIS